MTVLGGNATKMDSSRHITSTPLGPLFVQKQKSPLIKTMVKRSNVDMARYMEVKNNASKTTTNIINIIIII